MSSLKKLLIEDEDIISLEVVNPDGETFEYIGSNIKGLYTYKDSLDNLYFVRLVYQPTEKPYLELKVGWFKDNNFQKPTYEPNLPPKSTSLDNIKRRNTVSKIYRDEIIPFFKNNFNNEINLVIKPISNSRFIFSQRLVRKYTPKDLKIQEDSNIIIISK